MTHGVQGGRFLVRPVGEADPFIPEELSPELQQLRGLAIDFVEGEVIPRDDDIEAQTPGVLPTLLKKAGELGLMMVEVPEAFGGLGLGKIAATVVAEGAAGQGSFTAALMCQTGIATMPVLYFGTCEQQEKYLSKLATGEFLGAYALTEAGAGSDALAARTKAVKTPDGKWYLLNGEKQFITNGGFADLMTVFAKVDGEHFSAFLVERTMPGVSHGPEEKKMGIYGSSTVPLILQDAKVPAANLLGEVGKGHQIAFASLNIGRWKLGAATMGQCKRILRRVVQYVKERHQFGEPLAAFELTQQKIAEMAIKIFLCESIVYRYAGEIDRGVAALDPAGATHFRERAKINEALAIEASISKVFCSESLFECADEAVQLFGGYGYLREYRPERYYRDNRINRIWEGTNEINRFLIPGTLMKRMAKGGIDFLTELTTILGELKSGFATVDPAVPLAVWQDQVNQLKKLVIYVGGVAVNVYGPDIQQRQQILHDMADLAIAAYVADSALARVLKLHRRDAAAAQLPLCMVTAYLARRLPELKMLANQAVANIAAGDAEKYRPYGKAVGKFLHYLPFDLVAARRDIAAVILARGEYGW
ncbi:MAG: acyl-CoA dehydrogenase family protein [Deltaproteobacteria bacterium]|nr:acyl-CoA dehydrogenase family protein [Deltaproteobacteria bacterium]